MNIIKNNFNIIILLILVILVLFALSNTENFIDLNNFVYYDENNNRINN